MLLWLAVGFVYISVALGVAIWLHSIDTGEKDGVSALIVGFLWPFALIAGPVSVFLNKLDAKP